MAKSKADLVAFIRHHRLGVVATNQEGASPQAALIYVVTTPELEILFYTLQTSRKCENLRRDKNIAIVIGLGGEETLQIEGQAQEIAEEDQSEAREFFRNEFPQSTKLLEWPGVTFFRVVPKWARFSRYGHGWDVEEFRFDR